MAGGSAPQKSREDGGGQNTGGATPRPQPLGKPEGKGGFGKLGWVEGPPPEEGPPPWRSVKSIRPMACAPEETVTTRDGAPVEQQAGEQERARWLRAGPLQPVGVTGRVFQKPPTLFTRTSSETAPPPPPHPGGKAGRTPPRARRRV